MSTSTDEFSRRINDPFINQVRSIPADSRAPVAGFINDIPDTDINASAKILFYKTLRKSFVENRQFKNLNKRTLSDHFDDKVDFHSKIHYDSLDPGAKTRADAWYDTCLNTYGGKHRAPKKTRKSKKARKSKKTTKSRKRFSKKSRKYRK
jgi:hypothetical protein